MRKIIFKEEEKEKIIDLYKNEQLSLTKIGKEFNVNRGVISRVLTEWGVKENRTNHIYKADYKKFQNINTPEKAYWLGFIAADGCVYVREQNATIRISIHQKDEEHLVKFRNFLNSNIPIKEFINASGYSTQSPSPMCAIAVNSKEMAQDFINAGVPPKKSLNLQPPKIEEKFYLPYIMGYFDGDGSIYKMENGLYGISFTGNYDMMNWINNILHIGQIFKYKTKSDQTYYIRSAGKNKPYQILKPMYESVNTHLDRKFELYNELEQVVLNRNIK